MSRLSNAAVVALALAGGAVVAGAPARADTVVFHATLSTADEVPPKTGAGRGSATATLDTTSRVVDYQVMYSDLSGAATMAHFHGPAAPGANAGVEVPLGTNAASPIKGSATLTELQMADLEGGKMYVNVHTPANPGGEIRGQLVRVP